jgi:L-2,4-diaminobutyric acid acetyltransferase
MKFLEGINITVSADKAIDKEGTVPKYRKPSLVDGAEVWNLVKNTGVLDLNSSYSYLMWCTHFSDTSVIVEVNNEVIGFVSGFIKQTSSNQLFIWQVAVDESERGKGLASKMLHHLLSRDSCKDINYIETTISPTNIPSRKLFHGLARDLGTEINVSTGFTMNDFPEEGHEDEWLHQIGPFK